MDGSKTILFLAVHPRSLFAIERFLSHRGWTVRTTSDEKEAVRVMLAEQPQFFMISIDHEQARKKKLPHLLQACFPGLHVFVFGEQNTILTYRKLQEAERIHRIPPPLTGPAIERAIRKAILPAQPVKKNKKEISMADDLLRQGALKAFDEVTSLSKSPVQKKLSGKTTHVACISVDSTKYSGYFLFAMAGDFKFENTFVQNLRDKLMWFLKGSGDSFVNCDSYSLKVKPLDFISWAYKKGEFVESTSHVGQEIVCSFVATKEVNVEVLPVDESQMHPVEIESLPADVELPFDLYIYLPKNQKSFKYVGQSQRLLNSQKTRLLTRGLLSLYIQNDQICLYKKMKIEERINSFIQPA